MLKTMGLGLGGRILTAKEEKFAKEELFFEYFTFLTWRLGGENRFHNSLFIRAPPCHPWFNFGFQAK